MSRLQLPPKWMMRFFRWYCREDLVDAIEGDLMEIYQRKLEEKSRFKANGLFLWHVLIFCQPFAIKRKSYKTQKPTTMWKNHFKIAFRLMNRQKAFALTNILGLSIGITASLFLLLYVSHELSYDSFHEDVDDIYRVNVISFNPEGNFYRTSAPSPVAELMSNTFPEVRATARITRPFFPDNLVKANDKEFFESNIYMSEEGFFDVFSFKLLHGDPKSALNEPSKVVLSESMALKYFGRTDVVGEVITYENRFPLNVTGVMEDTPSNSTLQFDAVISNRTQGLMYRNWINHWGSSNAAIYVKLENGTDPNLTAAKFPNVVEQYIKDDLDPGERFVMSLQPMKEIHLNPHVAPELVNESSNKKYTYILPVVGLFILLIAGFNYVNLSTARMSERLKEVGVRKVMGSSTKNLRTQFLVESLMIVLMAMITSIVLISVLLPGFNQMANKSFGLSELMSPLFLGTLFGLSLILGLASGIYPALVLSKAKVITALKQGFDKVAGGKAYLRSFLLTVQFAVALIMIIATVVINNQMSYLQQKPLGFDAEQVIYFRQTDRAFWKNAQALKNELLKNPKIKSVAFSSGVPSNHGYGSTASLDNDTREFEINHIMLDEDFFNLYGFEIADGRNFDFDLATDKSAAYLINETAAREIGWEEPLGEKLEFWGKEGQVIGIVKDFHFESMKRAIGPIAFHISSSNYRAVSIKLATDDIAETINFLDQQWAQMVPDRPFQFEFMDARFEEYYEEEQRFSGIMDMATGLGLVLAVSGLFSLMAFLINKRAKEISIRKVLGATYLNVMKLFLSRLVWVGVIAIAIAIPIAYLTLSEWLDGFAYHVNVSTISFVLATSFLAVIMVVTVGAQVTRSTSKNPVDNLRYE